MKSISPSPFNECFMQQIIIQCNKNKIGVQLTDWRTGGDRLQITHIRKQIDENHSIA